MSRKGGQFIDSGAYARVVWPDSPEGKRGGGPYMIEAKEKTENRLRAFLRRFYEESTVKRRIENIVASLVSSRCEDEAGETACGSTKHQMLRASVNGYTNSASWKINL